MTHHQMNRRAAIRVGGAGVLGLSLQNILAAAGTMRASAKSVIFLHQYGGPGQHETFDMKPNAPAEVRGSFKPMQTGVPGLHVCEMLPRVADVAKHLTVIRCAQHTMKNHNSAAYYSLTGIAPPSDDQRLRDSLDLFPAYGSVVDKFSPAARGMPTFVSFPHVIRDGSITPGQHASFLGKAHDPFFFAQDPNKPDFRLPELSLPATVSPARMANRSEALKIIDAQAERMDRSSVARGLDESYHKAVSMLSSTHFKKAFDLSAETPETRDRYGRTTYGQSCLLARRLVEAGAKFINVYFSESIGGDKGGWDVHGFDNHPQDPILKNHLLPITNQTLPTLVTDLEERGLLQNTLVLWMGEFGRSPKINKLAGRDHWPQCYSLVMAGGGVKGGYVYGASDKTGAYPAVGQARPEDISATLFHLMGIDPTTEIRDKLNRPLPISRGEVIRDVIA